LLRYQYTGDNISTPDLDAHKNPALGRVHGLVRFALSRNREMTKHYQEGHGDKTIDYVEVSAELAF